MALFYLHKRDRTSHSDLTNLCFIVCYLVKTEYRLGSEFSIFYILSAKSKGYSGIKIVPLAKKWVEQTLFIRQIYLKTISVHIVSSFSLISTIDGSKIGRVYLVARESSIRL